MYEFIHNFNDCADGEMRHDGTAVSFHDHETGTESYRHWDAMASILNLVEAGRNLLDISKAILLTDSKLVPKEDIRLTLMDMADIGENERQQLLDLVVAERTRHRRDPYELVIDPNGPDEYETAAEIRRGGKDCISVWNAANLSHWQDMVKILNVLAVCNEDPDDVMEAVAEYFSGVRS